MLILDDALANQIKKLLITHRADLEELQKLKTKVSTNLKKRKQPFINASELDEIIRWKLDKQYHRSKKQREVNDDKVVIPITTATFSIDSVDEKYKLELQLKLLTSLRGVAIPLASAVLAICYPKSYAVIDSLLWQLLYKEEKSSFTVSDYQKFIEALRKFSQLTNMDVQTTEFGLWLFSMTIKE